MLEIPADLAPPLVPLAWMLGTWRGVGLGDYPTIESFRYGQEIVVGYTPGKPFLAYDSRAWLIDDDGEVVRPLARETGWWRPQPDGTVELLLAHPTGFVEIYLGEVTGAKIELRTDLVARTATAKDYTAGHRLYGYVEGDLLYAYDMAAMGQPLQSHLSARLKRAAGPESTPGPAT
jgi:hypothetical protein